jgi:hypothetical protein
MLATNKSFNRFGAKDAFPVNSNVMRHSTPLYLIDVETPVIGGGRASVDEFKGDRLLRTIQSKKRGQQ